MLDKEFLNEIEDDNELNGCDCDDIDCEGCDYKDDDLEGETTIVMSDAEGNEYEFMLYDEFDFKDQTYLLLMTMDDDDPELVIVKVVEDEDEVDTLMSVDDDEYDEVFEEYLRICEEEGDCDEDFLEET